jgi:hypothetical protein
VIVARFRETVVGAVLACAFLLAGPGAAGSLAAELEEEPICVGDSCQPLPPEPEDPTPGTLVPNPGNPPLHVYEPKAKGKKHRKNHGHGARGHGKRGAAKRHVR